MTTVTMSTATASTATASTGAMPVSAVPRSRSGAGPRYAGLWRRMPWELGYLAVTAMIGLASLSVFRAIESVGAGLLAVVVGVGVFALLLIATRYLGVFELFRLRLARLPRIQAPAWQPPFRTGKGFFRTLGDVFANPHSWLYYLHSAVLNPILAVITAAVWLPWLTIGTALALTPAWAFLRPFTSTMRTVSVDGRPPLPITGWSLGEISTYALSGSTAGLPWFVVGCTALGLGLLAAFPLVTRGLSMAHWGLGRLLLARFRSEELGAEVQRVGAAQRAAVAAEDNALRRLERDIHDGPQQRLLRLQMELSAAERQLRTADGRGPTGAPPRSSRCSRRARWRRRRSTSCARSRRASLPRCCRTAGCRRRSRRWPGAARCRSRPTSASRTTCRRRWSAARTSSRPS